MAGEQAEEALVRRAQAGDRVAFDELVRRYQRPLYGYAYRLTGARELAAEVTQEVFLRAWQYLGRFDAGRPLKPWLYAICANRAATGRQRDRNRDTVGLEELSGEPPAPERTETGLEQAELARRVQAALVELSPQQRQAVVLCELEGLTAVEAGEIMGIEAVTVRQHVFRAKKRLRVLLAAYVTGDDES